MQYGCSREFTSYLYLLDNIWPAQWYSVLDKAPSIPKKFPVATASIHTPFTPAHWDQILGNYDIYKLLAKFFPKKFHQEFRIAYLCKKDTLQLAYINLSYLFKHMEEVDGIFTEKS